MNHDMYRGTVALCAALNRTGIHAAIVGTGGGCEAVEARWDDNYGTGRHVLITDGDAGAPFRTVERWSDDVIDGYYGVPWIMHVTDRQVIAAAYATGGEDAGYDDEPTVIVDEERTTIDHVVARTLLALS